MLLINSKHCSLVFKFRPPGPLEKLENITGKSQIKAGDGPASKAVSKLLNKTTFWFSLVNCLIKEADWATHQNAHQSLLLGKTFGS